MIKYVIEPQMGFDAFEIDSLKMRICYIVGLYHILSGVYWSYIYVGRINIVRVSREGYNYLKIMIYQAQPHILVIQLHNWTALWAST